MEVNAGSEDLTVRRTPVMHAGRKGLRAAGKLRADVARSEHSDARAMQRADTAGERFPAARADDLGILHLAAQQHQADHDEMLGDGGAVGAGGVGEPTVGILVQALGRRSGPHPPSSSNTT